MGRFERVRGERYHDSRTLEIVVDNETGVNYLITGRGGITPLLDKDGKPVITPIK